MKTNSLATPALCAGLAAIVLGLLPQQTAVAAAEGDAKIVLNVAPEGSQFTSVQAAIDAAPPWATVRIAPGLYTESLTIRKPVILEGARWEQTTIAAPPSPSVDSLRGEVRQLQTQLATAATDAEKRQLTDAFLNKHTRPAIRVTGTRGVTLRGLKFTATDTAKDDRAITPALVVLSLAKVRMTNCAVLGSPRDGIQVVDGSDVAIEKCLVAAVWSTGIVVGVRGETAGSRAAISDCDVRNCYYAGFKIRSEQDVRIERCRISGAAWHGIRYDDVSPTIAGNRIFGNARCGIYASGKTAATVENNLFLENAMGGVSCWFDNTDTIAHNTFAQNQQAGLSVIGSSRPVVSRNIFYGHPRAITRSSTDENRVPGAVGDPILEKNLYWQNDMDYGQFAGAKADPSDQWSEVELPAASESLLVDPGFVDVAAGDFSLTADSPARRQGIGVAEPLSADSPWPLQPEEEAIIPEGTNRHFRDWKNAESKSQQTRDTRTAAEREVSYQAALADLFEVLGHEYPCFTLKEIDWPAVGRELLPRAKQVQSDDEFGLLCMELVARLEDSHAMLSPAAANLPTLPAAYFDPGLACLVGDAGKPVVYHVDGDGPAAEAGIQPGMTVISVDGEPVEDVMTQRMEQLSRYTGYSSDRYLRYHAAQFLLRQMERGEAVTVELEDPSGKCHTHELAATRGIRYLPRLPVPIPGIQDSANVSWKMLDGQIGYIYVRRIRNDLIAKLDQAVAGLKDARGLIVDVRGNSGGGFDSARAHRNFSLDDQQEPQRPRYKGPMALLIDARCISAGEGWASWFVANDRATLFGEATAGASSRKRTYRLENGLYNVTFPVKAYRGYLDRPIERRGLEPDVPLRQNANDLAEGRDTVLEAARKALLEN